jgi:hypothetical protein
VSSLTLTLFEQLNDSELDRLVAERVTQRRDPRLRCASCGHAITEPRERLQVDGAHGHVFTNPHGLSFEIGCFRNAPGCRAAGRPTDEHTWFPGYAWRVALCAGCGVHLGWYYQGGGGGRFYGLILERLVAAES